ncbi:MAG: hypothetical protein HFI74_03185 [Lachnospiraceae bacterium]|jgi:hypothetical protein|nr:hypothetical protein [Lachnospiraceae bacterium]
MEENKNFQEEHMAVQRNVETAATQEVRQKPEKKSYFRTWKEGFDNDPDTPKTPVGRFFAYLFIACIMIFFISVSLYGWYLLGCNALHEFVFKESGNVRFTSRNDDEIMDADKDYYTNDEIAELVVSSLNRTEFSARWVADITEVRSLYIGNDYVGNYPMECDNYEHQSYYVMVPCSDFYDEKCYISGVFNFCDGYVHAVDVWEYELSSEMENAWSDWCEKYEEVDRGARK